MQAPYPSDTRAKGWRFELDHERIRQSDTWALAAPDARPWLLMLWMVAWEQTPCGSLPNDDALIAARMGMPVKAFAKHRGTFMRGWWLADDGRMYHDTIVSRVRAMLDKRATDAQRAASHRARKANTPEVTDVSRVTHTEVRPEFDTKHQAPSTKEKTKPPSPSAKPPLCPDDVDSQVWADWVALRKAKRATASATAVTAARQEADKAGMSLEAFLRVWCARGSQGLEAGWLKPHERSVPRAVAEPAWRTEQRERAAQFAGPAAARKQTAMEVVDDVPRLVG